MQGLYTIGATESRTGEEFEAYIEKIFHETRGYIKLDEYVDLRKDGKLVTICEKDKETKGIYYLFSPPYRLAPLYA